MYNIAWLVKGGFLKGYRTKLIALGLVVQAVIAYLVGDLGFEDAVRESWVQIVAAVGLVTASDAHKPEA